MGDIADDMISGVMCSWCGICFEEEHGYPVICRDCLKGYLKNSGTKKELLKEYGLQPSINKKLLPPPSAKSTEGIDPPGWCRTHNRQDSECKHILLIEEIHSHIFKSYKPVTTEELGKVIALTAWNGDTLKLATAILAKYEVHRK